MLADPCADPRIFARVVQAPLPENSSNISLSLFVLNSYSFTVAYQWFISKKSIISLGFGGGGGGGGSDLFQGVKLFPWGRGRGPKCLF